MACAEGARLIRLDTKVAHVCMRDGKVMLLHWPGAQRVLADPRNLPDACAVTKALPWVVPNFHSNTKAAGRLKSLRPPRDTYRGPTRKTAAFRKAIQL